MGMDTKNLPSRDGTAHQKLAQLFDEGTLVELGAYVGDSDYAGVVCGYGAVNDALTFAFAQDFSRNKGAFGEAEAKKIISLYELAKKNGAPVIGIYASAGAKVTEGAKTLAAFGQVLAKMTEVSGVIPQIAVVDGVCAGLSATAVTLSDILIASEDGKFYIAPPSVLKAQGDKEAGSVAEAAEEGLIDVVCANGDEAIAKAREIASMIPQNNRQGLAFIDAGDDMGRPTPDAANAADTAALVAMIADNGNYTELKKAVAPEALTALASVGSLTAGIVANAKGASLTPAAARKMASFISFCDNFSIPVISLVDTCGIELTKSAEKAPYASELARLASAYAAATCPKITAVVGKAYGAAFTLMGSKSIGADVVLALPTAEISVMEPDAAVQFIYGEEIKAAADPVADRQAKKDAWIAGEGSAVAAAQAGEVDDIVEPAELRARIISACMMLWSKADGEIRRKHSKLPF